MLDVNTVSNHPTHFLRAVDLIIRARGLYNIPSENWPHPIKDRFGIPNDRYYAEVWVDGMDWQPSYWVIEEKELEKPHIYPFIIFSKTSDRMKFNDWDFSELIKAALWFRRDKYFIKQNDLGYFTDMVWPFLFTTKQETAFPVLSEVYFSHASQPRVEFMMNKNFIPSTYLGRKQTKGKIISSIPASNRNPEDVGD